MKWTLFLLFFYSVNCDILGWLHLVHENFVLQDFDFLIVELSKGRGTTVDITLTVDPDGGKLNLIFMDLENFERWKKYGELSDDCLVFGDTQNNNGTSPIFALGNGLCGHGWVNFECSLSTVDRGKCQRRWRQNPLVQRITLDEKMDNRDWRIVIYSPERKQTRFTYDFDFDSYKRQKWMLGAAILLVSAFALIIATIFGGLYIWTSHKRRLRIHQLASPTRYKGRPHAVNEPWEEDNPNTPLLDRYR